MNTTTIDLAKFEEAKKTRKEAQETIDSIGTQFCEMVLDEIEKTSVFECEDLLSTHQKHSMEVYSSAITVSDTPVCLSFSVYPRTDNPSLVSDFIWIGFHINCSSFEISDRFIRPRKSLTLTLHFTDVGKSMLLHYEAPEGN